MKYFYGILKVLALLAAGFVMVMALLGIIKFFFSDDGYLAQKKKAEIFCREDNLEMKSFSGGSRIAPEYYFYCVQTDGDLRPIDFAKMNEKK